LARITLSALDLELLGPLAGVVGIKTLGGPTLRKRYKDPKASPKQLQLRAAFTFTDDSYSQLNEAQRTPWRTAGKPRKLTGYTYWMKINVPRIYRGLPLLVDPP
jgi:hypothetical protein